MALALFSGCAQNGYLGDGSLRESPGCAISFNGKSAPVTRAVSGADAAALLGGGFVVYGSKSNGSSYSTVFDGYNVKWAGANPGETLGNTWEYVGQQTLDNHVQGVKYWDYNTQHYTFIAFSKGGGYANFSDVNPANIGTDRPIYTIKGQPNDDQLYPLYLAEPVQVNKANYGKEPVSISFRPFRTKARFGIYETIPGYSVENVNFYHSSSIVSPGGNHPTIITDDNFLPNMGEFEYSVYSSGIGDRLSVQCVPKQGVQYKHNVYFDTLAYSSDGMLGTTSASASYFQDSLGNSYINVLPTGDNSGKLGIRVDFTLVPLDGSDSHKITVRGAMAYIPEEFIRWQPGYAYTYLFKISDAVDGLYPITFDAQEYLASDPLDAETIEGVIPITTYQKGSAMEESGAYNTTDNIYVTVGDFSQLQKLSVGQNGYVRLFRAEGLQQVTEKAVYNCIVNGNYDNSTYTYSVTDAAGHTFSLTDVSENMSILYNYDEDDYPYPSWKDSIKYNGIACISGQEAGTYVFVYRPQQSEAANFNTLPTGVPCYSFMEEEDDDGNTYYMDYFTATGFETYDVEEPLIKDTYLHNDYMHPISDDGVGYVTYKYLTADNNHAYFALYDGYYHELYGIGNDNTSLASYSFYRLQSATYFTEYKIGDIIENGDMYFEKLSSMGDEVPVYNVRYSHNKYGMNIATAPIEITAANVGQYVYVRRGTHKVNEFPFYSVSVKAGNNTKLLKNKWYWAVDGYDDFENDDGTYDDSNHIYVEERMSTSDYTLAQLNEEWDNGIIGELIDVVEWQDGTYGEWYYNEDYFDTDVGVGTYRTYLEMMYGFYDEYNDFCTLAPLSYIYCDGNGKKQIYSAEGTEMRGDIYSTIGVYSDNLYMDDKGATMYSKIITVR